MRSRGPISAGIAASGLPKPGPSSSATDPRDSIYAACFPQSDNFWQLFTLLAGRSSGYRHCLPNRKRCPEASIRFDPGRNRTGRRHHSSPSPDLATTPATINTVFQPFGRRSFFHMCSTGSFMSADLPFWQTTPLDQMSETQWESLCDGCGRCCLNKLRDEDTDEIVHTDVACRLLDTQTCQCTDYLKRHRKVPDCVSLTPAILADIDWLPPSCSYRLLRDGFDLPEWHHLKSGGANGVHNVQASVQGRCISERRAGPLENHLAQWPGEWPKFAPACAKLKKSA